MALPHRQREHAPSAQRRVPVRPRRAGSGAEEAASVAGLCVMDLPQARLLPADSRRFHRLVVVYSWSFVAGFLHHLNNSIYITTNAIIS